MGLVAYRIQLPPASQIHQVFHVSQLKKQIGAAVFSSPTLPPTSTEGQMLVYPVAILSRKMVKKHNQVIAQILVQWSNTSPADMTWEDASFIRGHFPDALDLSGPQLHVQISLPPPAPKMSPGLHLPQSTPSVSASSVSTPPSVLPTLIPPRPKLRVQRQESIPLLPRELDLPAANSTMMIEVVPDTHVVPKVQRQDLTLGIEAIPDEDVAGGPEIPGVRVSQTSTKVIGGEEGKSVILVILSEEAKAKKDLGSA
ncbi:hypothetical protein LWI28_010709 [Acer negundo]|uniref:Tf2-1-like SH3-like domain-containing protein n=1 Tax=Acer negundo TaxID=4023 RepID=A0AAD5IJ18_ACENE|nr:hypothetical protein LWI28_010709 [Acer negundo]